jgi:hypothetical protein
MASVLTLAMLANHCHQSNSRPRPKNCCKITSVQGNAGFKFCGARQAHFAKTRSVAGFAKFLTQVEHEERSSGIFSGD